uniref:Uncharacterized protein n=1 Tax=Panagrolaimus sp. ES5 TaxID=591445 RepID=A0AC34GX85_9BILA
MKFHLFALLILFAAIFAVDAHIINKDNEKKGAGIVLLPPPGKPCWGTPDCPPGQICVFPWPDEGIGKCE